MEVGWDHKIAAKLREEKLTQDQIGFVLGLIAEQRMNSDFQGYKRGYNLGYDAGFEHGRKQS